MPLDPKINDLDPFVRYVKIDDKSFSDESFWNFDNVFALVVEGSSRFGMEGRWFTVEAGDVILMPPDLLHVLRTEKCAHFVQYIFHFDLFRRNASDMPERMILDRLRLPSATRDIQQEEKLLDEYPRVLRPGPDAVLHIKRLFLDMLREFNERRPSFEAMLRSYALQILIMVLRDADRTAALEGAPRGGLSARLRTAMEYINLHYDDNALTVEEVAEWVKYSPNYLTSLFSRAMGLSVYQYIVYVRIENAKRLISMGNMAIGDIATAVGYSSVYVFCRSFKHSVGMSATEYAANRRRSDAG